MNTFSNKLKIIHKLIFGLRELLALKWKIKIDTSCKNVKIIRCKNPFWWNRSSKLPNPSDENVELKLSWTILPACIQPSPRNIENLKRVQKQDRQRRSKIQKTPSTLWTLQKAITTRKIQQRTICAIENQINWNKLKRQNKNNMKIFNATTKNKNRSLDRKRECNTIIDWWFILLRNAESNEHWIVEPQNVQNERRNSTKQYGTKLQLK